MVTKKYINPETTKLSEESTMKSNDVQGENEIVESENRLNVHVVREMLSNWLKMKFWGRSTSKSGSQLISETPLTIPEKSIQIR